MKGGNGEFEVEFGNRASARASTPPPATGATVHDPVTRCGQEHHKVGLKSENDTPSRLKQCLK